MLKFHQVDVFKHLITAFKGKQLVEATFNDFWGIGVHFSRDMEVNPKQWQGENVLGEILTTMANKL